MNHYLNLASDSTAARYCVKNLLDNGFDEHRISLIGNASLELDPVSIDNECETWDSIAAVQRSIVLGGNPGMFAQLRAVVLPSINVTLCGGAIHLSDLVRVGAPGIMTRFIHHHLPPRLLSILQNRIEQGNLLLALEVDQRRVAWLDRLVNRICPDIRFISDLGMAKVPGDDRFMELVLCEARGDRG